jgi:ATP-dependent helicase/nuclease subunit B
VSAAEPPPVFGERTPIVVASSLASRQWELHLGAESIAAGRRAWPTPDLVHYSSWTERLWQTGPLPLALPLSASQSLALWRRIVAESEEGADLIGVRGAAHWAAEAWELLCHWDIDPERERAGASQGDYRAFLGWCRRYAATLAEHGWVDRATIARRLTEVEWRAPEQLILADLDESTPRQRALLERLAQRGCRIGRWMPPDVAAVRLRIRLGDARDELRAAVEWARARLAAAPATRIALVVPALDERRAEIDRAVEEPLAGDSTRVPVWYANRGIGDAPRLGAALEALALGTAVATFETLSRWLRSPFFGRDDGERAACAALERELRRDVRAQLSFRTAYRETALPALLERAAPRAARALSAALGETHGIERATPSRWAAAWQRALTLLEWGGASEPDDALRWHGALDELARLTPLVGELDHAAALAELGRALESAPPAPLPVRGIHVLERVEDVGPGYDATWLTGFTDQAWPEPARANPLLPRALQRRHEMPWSTPDDARARSARALERLARRVPTLVASWPARVFDYETEPSPALRDWGELETAGLSFNRPRAARRRETVVDRAPALAGTELHGGAGVLSRQARCPLRAFCEYRLGARALERPSSGLNGRQRGTATHNALELLLAEGFEHSDLATRRAALGARAERALDEVFRDARPALRALFRLETERLERALARFLELEQLRAPFRIEAVERREAIEVAGFALRVRADRVDRLADGGIAIVDYKTGDRVTSADWFKERLRDVQVPFYAAHSAAPVEAAVIARVGAREAGYRGFWQGSAFPGKPNKLRERDWPAQIARWRAQIEELVREHVAGDTRVFLADRDEASGPYAPLTRIDEQLALARGSVARW